MTSVLGTRRLRREDPALLTGEARFVDDLAVPGALHAKVVRSPYAHARITGLHVEAELLRGGVEGERKRGQDGAPREMSW